MKKRNDDLKNVPYFFTFAATHYSHSRENSRAETKKFPRMSPHGEIYGGGFSHGEENIFELPRVPCLAGLARKFAGRAADDVNRTIVIFKGDSFEALARRGLR